MNRKIKTIIALASLAAIMGTASLFSQNKAPNAQTNTNQVEPTELPTGEEPDTPLSNCVSPTRKIEKKLMGWGKLHVYLTRHDRKKALDHLKALNEERGLKPNLAGNEATGHTENHDQASSIAFPDVDLSVIAVDPFDGCEVVAETLENGPLLPSDKITNKQVKAVYRAYWKTVFTEVEDEFNLTAQSWLNELTHSVGLGHRRLSESDISAIKFFKLKLPEWYAKDFKDGHQRDLAILKVLQSKGDKTGKIPIDQETLR